MTAESRLDASQRYLRRGWQPLPISEGSKAPAMPNWPDFRADENVAEYFSGPGNIGVLLGEPSGNLVDIDVDAPEALAFAQHFLLPTDSVFGRVSKPRSHWLYIVEAATKTAKFQDPTCPSSSAMLVELRSTGAQTIFPPSTHPSGEHVEWHRNGEPAGIDAAVLLQAVQRLAAAALLVRHYPAEGSRHEFALAISGALVRGGWSSDKIAEFLQVVAYTAGDPETHDRVRAGKYSQERIASGRPATGWKRLAKLLGRDVVDRLREWLASAAPGETSATDTTAESSVRAENSTTLANEIRQIALEKKPGFDKKREITQLVKDDLLSQGQFFRTGDSRGFFFHNVERRLYDVEQAPFQRLITSVSGLSSTETFFKFAIDLIQTSALRESRLAEVHTLSHYAPTSGMLAVSDCGPGIWIRELGGEWEQIRNGENGLFFLTDDDSTPWQPEFGDEAPQRWWLNQFLFAHHILSAEESKTLLHVLISQQFFPPLRRTRVVPCFLGAQGSGKTTAMRLIGRLLAGKEFDVTGVRRDKEDAFVAAVSNRVVLALDNADSAIPWLADALATYATGQRYRLRKLYTTNEEATYSPRSILLISSRDPRFNRPDVTERLLPMHCERPEQYQTEEEIFSELEKRRGQIMGSLLLHLGRIADALPVSPPEPLTFRMADFASFGERIFRARGKSAEFVSLLKAMEKNQVELASAFDGTVEAIRILLENRGSIEGVSISDLYQECSKIAQESNLLIARTAHGFGRHFSNMRRVLEVELGVRMVEVGGHAGRRLVSLVPTKKSALVGVTNEPS